MHSLDAPHCVRIDECLSKERQVLVCKCLVTEKTMRQALAQLARQDMAISVHHTASLLSGDADVRKDNADVEVLVAQLSAAPAESLLNSGCGVSQIQQRESCRSGAEVTEEQKWKTKCAAEARSRYRWGLKYSRLPDKSILAPEQIEI